MDRKSTVEEESDDESICSADEEEENPYNKNLDQSGSVKTFLTEIDSRTCSSTGDTESLLSQDNEPQDRAKSRETESLLPHDGELQEDPGSEHADNKSEQSTSSAEQLPHKSSKPRSDTVDLKNSLSVFTPGTGVSHGHGWSLRCDACQTMFPTPDGIYCRTCLQRLCATCAGVHGNLSTSSDHLAEQIALLHHKITLQATKELLARHDSLLDGARYLERFTGLQVSLNVRRAELEISSMDEEILEIARETVEMIGETRRDSGITRTLHNAGIEWTFHGDTAAVVKLLFRNNLSALAGTFDYVTIYCTHNGKRIVMTDEGRLFDDTRRADTAELYGRLSRNSVALEDEEAVGGESDVKEVNEVVIRTTDMGEYIALRDIIEDLEDQIDALFKAEVTRPAKDELKMRLYVMTKEGNSSVACTLVRVGSALKMVIRSRDKEVVMETKEEFVSIFCKECSVCLAETSHPLYLSCKHVLCRGCIHHSANLNNGMKCPICSLPRQATPVRSLQAHCVDLLDEFFTGSSDVNSTPGKSLPRNKARAKSTQHQAIKIPKYVLKRWKRQTGGLKRLKSLVVNEYGLLVGGSDDCLKIYGGKLNILELAVQSIENLHDKSQDTEISKRLTDKCVEWRFRGNWAKKVFYLFSKELQKLKDKFKTVVVKVFPNKYPSVVEIKCTYKEYEQVRYEVDEIENGARKLFQDETIQPRNFYYNKKVTEFLESKKMDPNVFCELTNRNNLNVITFKARKKEHITSAKDELSKW